MVLSGQICIWNTAQHPLLLVGGDIRDSDSCVHMLAMAGISLLQLYRFMWYTVEKNSCNRCISALTGELAYSTEEINVSAMLPLSDNTIHNPSEQGGLIRGAGGRGEKRGPRGAITAMLRPERDLYKRWLNTRDSEKSEAGWTEGTMGEDGVGGVSSVWGLIWEFCQYNCVLGLILSCIRPRLARIRGPYLLPFSPYPDPIKFAQASQG